MSCSKMSRLVIFLMTLSCAQFALGQARKASSSSQKAWMSWEELWEKTHSIGIRYARMGRFDDAEGSFNEALKIAEAHFAPGDPRTTSSLCWMSTAVGTRGKYGESIAFAKRAVELGEAKSGPESLSVARALDCLGTALMFQGKAKAAEAEVILKRAIPIFEKELGLGDWEAAKCLMHSGQACSVQAKYAEAESFQRRAVAIAERYYEAGNPNLAAFLESLGRVLTRRGNYAEAEPLLERALALREKALSPDHPDIASVLASLANLRRDMGKLAEAEPLYVKAISISTKSFGPDHSTTARIQEDYAVLVRKLGRAEEAENLANDAKANLERSK